ncbi:MAG TPA: thioredoxin family protein [Gaiellaceae bacterium]|jgi:thioredoxin-like negative regulator of GroEL|nr:thioredoxin family protein [Gaiellaceae bacterium]
MQPQLVLFTSRRSGRGRRVEAYLAQVLQRRHNHETFRYYRVAQEERPDLLEKFGIALTPTLVVVEDRRIRGRLESPRSSRQISSFLAPWLQ